MSDGAVACGGAGGQVGATRPRECGLPDQHRAAKLLMAGL